MGVLPAWSLIHSPKWSYWCLWVWVWVWVWVCIVYVYVRVCMCVFAWSPEMLDSSKVSTREPPPPRGLTYQIQCALNQFIPLLLPLFHSTFLKAQQQWCWTELCVVRVYIFKLCCVCVCVCMYVRLCVCVWVCSCLYAKSPSRPYISGLQSVIELSRSSLPLVLANSSLWMSCGSH